MHTPFLSRFLILKSMGRPENEHDNTGPTDTLEVTGIVNPKCVFPSVISVTVLCKPERRLDRCPSVLERKGTEAGQEGHQ